MEWTCLFENCLYSVNRFHVKKRTNNSQRRKCIVWRVCVCVDWSDQHKNSNGLGECTLVSLACNTNDYDDDDTVIQNEISNETRRRRGKRPKNKNVWRDEVDEENAEREKNIENKKKKTNNMVWCICIPKKYSTPLQTRSHRANKRERKKEVKYIRCTAPIITTRRWWLFSLSLASFLLLYFLFWRIEKNDTVDVPCFCFLCSVFMVLVLVLVLFVLLFIVIIMFN